MMMNNEQAANYIVVTQWTLCTLKCAKRYEGIKKMKYQFKNTKETLKKVEEFMESDFYKESKDLNLKGSGRDILVLFNFASFIQEYENKNR